MGELHPLLNLRDMKKLAIFISLLILSFEGISFATLLLPPSERNIFRVAILGDRTFGRPEGINVLKKAVDELNQLNPDFVIHIGDMVSGYTRDKDQWLREAHEFKSIMGNLTIPWYPVAGNHDVISASRDPKDRTYEELYKLHFGELYYSFDYKNSHFVIIYTDEAMTSTPKLSKGQLNWLKRDLESTQKDNVFIFMHKPIWSYEDSNWKEFHDMIKQFPVRAVFAGHFHAYYKSISRDGIQYYNVGVTGGASYTSGHELTGYINHYLILSVEGSKYKLAIVRVGSVEADDYILGDDYANIYTITRIPNNKTGLTGWLWQPINEPSKGEIRISVSNPLSKPVSVKVRLNPTEKVWRMEPPSLEFQLVGNTSDQAQVTLSAPVTRREKISPPEIEFEYNYIDSYGRNVPVILRRRVPLRDQFTTLMAKEMVNLDGQRTENIWEEVLPIFLHTWSYSVYEKGDKPPKLLLAADDESLYFFAEIMDDSYSYINWTENILSDAIIFSSILDGEFRNIVIFPFDNEKTVYIAQDNILKSRNKVPVEGVLYECKPDQTTGCYYCEGKIPLSLLFAHKLQGDFPFNVTVIDNDLDAFIYVKSWTYYDDPQYWGVLRWK